MANSIRTPKVGINIYAKRIAEAVDNEEWQRFRVSMKGKSTHEKLDMLKRYYTTHSVGGQFPSDDVKIRVDNYIKALCRGGQLYPGQSLDTALVLGWHLEVKK
jgi:hypothetical protein